jgi:NAD-dependent deacetylase
MGGVSLAELKDISEVVRNFGQGLALVGGIVVLITWLYARRDRSTEVLLRLENEFGRAEIRRGRELIESDAAYREIRRNIIYAITREDEFGAGYDGDGARGDPNRLAIEQLDSLLRFYVLLYGVRAAGQVPDASLKRCFRFWLAHYYSPTRRELRLYVDAYYPTLSQWLRDDRRWWRRWFRRSFFTPDAFGWKTEGRPSAADIRRAAAGRVLVISGAGISRDSGVPTYRGEEGYWRKENPRALARLSAFERDPAKIWTWYVERRTKLGECRPNDGHFAVAALGRRASDFLLVTQNVDHFHEAAGVPPAQLVHIHGELRINRCTRCTFRSTTAVELPPLPRCPDCEALLRPGVVWFDEDLDRAEITRVEDFLARGSCDLILVVGTTASFSYIVDWALRGASKAGCLVEINPAPTALTAAIDLTVRQRAVRALPRLLDIGPADLAAMRAGDRLRGPAGETTGAGLRQ